jgi:thiol-disulfide isomerase/thioredoxin
MRMNARSQDLQTKAQPVLGLFLGVLLALCVTGFVAPTAWAQFEKTRWPARVPTPAFTAVDLNGRTWTSADFAGKVVVLNFWATWCPPCKEEMPSLQTLHDISDSHTLVLAVNVNEPAARVARYAQSTGLSLPIVLDSKSEMVRRFGVTAFPTTVLIGPDGQARWRIVGDVDWSGAQANGWLAEVRQNASPANAPSKAATLKR